MGLQARLEEVRGRIARAAQAAGRRESEILLLAVTKVFPVEVLLEAYALGLREFGESYVQEFERKFEQVAGLAGARFHLIGHLQSNKSRKASAMFQVIQTVDSARLAQRLAEGGEPLGAMIEVKLYEEQAQQDAAPEDLAVVIEAIRQQPSLQLTGLMKMPPWSDEAELAGPYFKRLKALAEQHGLTKLSMGRSHDLGVASQDGSTLGRVCSAQFRSRKPLV